jgi:hypothetical protein
VVLHASLLSSWDPDLANREKSLRFVIRRFGLCFTVGLDAAVAVADADAAVAGVSPELEPKNQRSYASQNDRQGIEVG